MEYVADTVTIIRHFTNTGKLGEKSKIILEDAEKGKHHITSHLKITHHLLLQGSGTFGNHLKEIRLDLPVF